MENKELEDYEKIKALLSLIQKAVSIAFSLYPPEDVTELIMGISLHSIENFISKNKKEKETNE